MMTTRGRAASVTVPITSDNPCTSCAPPAGYSMNQPWLTIRDWPVNALVFAAAKKSAASATSLGRRELAVDRFPQHHIVDDLVLGNSERFCLFRNLLVHQGRPYEPRADDVRSHAMLGAFLGD